MTLAGAITAGVTGAPSCLGAGYEDDSRNARSASDDIEIIEGKDRTVYEYRRNGILMLIKVVPKKGRPYYLAPADGSPHYEGLEGHRHLYPKWVIVEW
ncbi:MAG: DUF2782 domain-containing protein [Proteobacteria bacterium]|nr:DUF2782 domain-containing protein [Pseudomonadota bacterium]